MTDLIDRQAVLDCLYACFEEVNYGANAEAINLLGYAAQYVKQMPTVEPKREEKRGEWVDKRGRIYCSVCGSAKPHFVNGDLITYWTGDYCNVCGALLKRRGADMRGAE